MNDIRNKNNHNNRNSYSLASLFCPNRVKDRTFNKRLVTLPKTKFTNSMTKQWKYRIFKLDFISLINFLK